MMSRNLYWLEISLACVRHCLLDGTAATYEFPNVFDTVSKVCPPNQQEKATRNLVDRFATPCCGKDEQKSTDNQQTGVPVQSQQAGVPLPPSIHADNRGSVGGTGIAGAAGNLRRTRCYH